MITANLSNMGTVLYQYDGEGRRVRKTVGSAVTTYVYDAAGQLAAEYSTQAPTAQGTVYLTADALGSTRLATNSSGALNRYDYLPFGEDLPQGMGGRGSEYQTAASLMFPTVPDVLSEKFTGKERDSETGLDYFGARSMSASQGRFTSSDPISGWPSQPQSWNRYAYAFNNPFRYIDPNGLASLDADGTWVGDYNGERDCSSSNGCLYWNHTNQQWEGSDPNPPPSLFDLPGQFFVGFAALVLNNDPSELWRIPYSIGAQLTGSALLSKGFQIGATWWKLRNARFAQTWAREAFGKGGNFSGQTVDEVAEALRTGVLDASDVPVEFVTQADGTVTLLNTRSTVALTLGGVRQPMWKLVDVTDRLGGNLRLAGQLANNPGAPASTVILLPSGRTVTIGH